MKPLLLFLIFLHYNATQAQNVGIGTANPTEKLEVSGGIKIGNTANAAEGTIRFNPVKKDFEGYNGTVWVSLTGGKSAWGNQKSYSYENEATTWDLSNGNNPAGHGLGNAIAISGNAVVAGASNDNRNSELAAGSAFLFLRTATGWMVKNKFYPPAYTNNDHFGTSVAITPTQLAVGASGFMINGVRKGKVFVFPYNESTGVGQSVALSGTNLSANSEFGRSVAMDGDYLAAGARLAKVGNNNGQGKAYLFKKESAGWVQQAELSAPDGAAQDQFGNAIALSGNYAAVGAPFASVGNVLSAGKVYLFQRNGTQWLPAATLTPPGLLQNQTFGASLFLKGDTLVVGGIDWNNSNHLQSKAFVYLRNGNNWLLQATLQPSDRMNGDMFGVSVHYCNGRVIVGSRGSVGASRYQGKAYLFKQVGTEWIEETILTSSNGQMYDGFGEGVGITADAAVVGAPGAEISSYPGNGRIYFFNR